MRAPSRSVRPPQVRLPGHPRECPRGKHKHGRVGFALKLKVAAQHRAYPPVEGTDRGRRMGLRTGLWTEVTTSEYAHERAALQFVRQGLRDREPFRAWANFTFIADDGTRNEVDLLVVSPSGVHLIEIKSHPGRMEGDAGTWTWIKPDGSRRALDNPLLLTERKAKKLKSVLLAQPAFRDPARRRHGFFLKAVVFLANSDLSVGINEAGRTDVYGPDPEDEDHPGQQRNRLPGIVKLLVHPDQRRGTQVDRPLSMAIAQAVEQAGIRESTTHRRVGIYELTELLGEGEGWQDFAAEHPHAKGTHRRIRIYLTSGAQTEDERHMLRRAAQREFRLLQGIDHPGIDKPLELLDHPRGPALVFPRDLEGQQLDYWLADHADRIDLLDRIELLRDLAETVRHAHRQGLYHRALAPQHVTVTELRGKPYVRIRDWQTATKESGASSSAGTGTTHAHLAALVDQQSRVYLAPETLRLPDAEAGPADMWSLGALALLILSGRPPAVDVDGLHETLRQQGCLSLAAVMDAPDKDLDFLVRQATMTDATNRLVSVDEFLEYLDLALEQLTSPAEKDPLEAGKGDIVGGAWTVSRRLGSGSTAIVLLAERDGRPEVLKVARDDDHARRLRDEYEVLARLRDRTIVDTYGLEQIAGRTVLRLEAASTTLADELRTTGRLSLDLLERYGSDLLDALVVLDDEGVMHRDLKPDNLGIAERGKNHERHLVLFDFSLTRVDPGDLRAGTAGYLDPFLEERDPRRWDAQAERYAAAVSLHQMATGVRPIWGDGSTDPLLTDLEVPTIDPTLFDPAVREPLTDFFARALHRRPGSRFDTAQDARRAWGQVFAAVDVTEASEESLAAADVDLDDATAVTALAELALPARVRNALERLDVGTVGELAMIPASRLVRLAGIGATTRREVGHLAQRIRERLSGVPAGAAPGLAGVDRIAEQLVPKAPADEDHRTAVAALLGLGDGPGSWLTQRSAAETTGLERTVVADALASARTRWRNLPDVTGVRRELIELLRRREGVAGADELAATLLTTRGSLAQDPVRGRGARAVVRAAIEAEAVLAAPTLVGRRVGDALLLALNGETEGDEGPEQWDADRLVDAAASLGEVADGLVAQRPLPDAQRCVAELRQVELPEGVGPLPDARLVRLAAAASELAVVSPRLELYPRGLAAEEAVAEARGRLLDRRGLTAVEVRERVRARFPKAIPLPGRPELDRLLEPLGLTWDEGARAYVLPARGGVLPSTFTTGPSTSTFRTPDERDAAVRDLDDRFARLASEGGFLALTVDRRRLTVAAGAVAVRLGATAVDLDAWLIAAMREVAANGNARWEAFVQADSAPRTDRRWSLLQRLVDQALPAVEERLRTTPGVAVVTGVGLFARYDRLQALERLRDTMTRGPASIPLTGLVVIVPGDDPSARPVIDGHPLPILTANQWAHLPGGWLRHNAEAA